MSTDLKFNIYGFARPTTRAEVSALLDEALRMADQLDATIADMGSIMEERPTQEKEPA